MRNQEHFPSIDSDGIPLPTLRTCPSCKNQTPVLSPHFGNPGDFGVTVCCGCAVVIDDNLEIQIPTDVDWSAISAKEKESILGVAGSIQKMKKEYETKRNCPSCGVKINIMQQCMVDPAWIISSLSGKIILPREGDFGICSSCIGVYIFGENGKEIRSATKAEVLDLTRKDEQTARLLMEVLQYYKQQKNSSSNLSMN